MGKCVFINVKSWVMTHAFIPLFILVPARTSHPALILKNNQNPPRQIFFRFLACVRSRMSPAACRNQFHCIWMILHGRRAKFKSQLVIPPSGRASIEGTLDFGMDLLVTRFSVYRSVPVISTRSGMTFSVWPPCRDPILTTAGSKASGPRLTQDAAAGELVRPAWALTWR